MAKISWLSLFSVIILIGGLVVFHPALFRVRRIECFTQYGACQADFINRVQFLVGRPIYLPLPRQQIAQTFADLAAVADVTAYRRLPSTLVLGVTLRRPIAVVLGASQQQVVVDDRGIVFDATDRSALPLMYVDGQVAVGTNLTGPQLAAAKLLNQVGSIIQTPVAGRLQNQLLSVTTGSGVEIILDINHVPADWGSSLQAIWARSKIDGKLMHKIDLRFSQPAVSF